jgi:hypothetical protein
MKNKKTTHSVGHDSESQPTVPAQRARRAWARGHHALGAGGDVVRCGSPVDEV